MSIDSAVLEEKKEEGTNGTKKREESGDELERKEQDAPLEIGEHYLVKRGEDSWRKYKSSIASSLLVSLIVDFF